jgi:hypothetical protein
LYCEYERSWSEYLEDELRSSAEWNKRINFKDTQVINLARDGSGIQQFGRIYLHEAKLFDPDIVLVNFISDDIWRDIYFRGMVQFKNLQELEDAVSSSLQKIMFKFHPFLLADRLGAMVGFSENSATLLRTQQRWLSAVDEKGVNIL